MPIIKSAQKKMRQDVVRNARNKTTKEAYKQAIKSIEKSEGKDAQKMQSSAYKAIDKAAKKGIIHENKAARLKSRVAKLSQKS